MKKHFIFAVIFLLLVAPYTLSNKIDHLRTIAVTAQVNTSNPCPQKTLNSLNQCSFSQCGVMSEFFSLNQMHTLLGALVFFIAFLTLCAGFNTPIYKPPKKSS